MSRRKQAKPKALLLSQVDEGDEDSSTAETGPKVTEEESMEDKQAAKHWCLSPNSLSNSVDDPADFSDSPEDESIDGNDTELRSQASQSLSSPTTLTVDEHPWLKTGEDSENYSFSCEFCDRAYQKPGHLRKHEQIHADQLPYSCDICQRLFRHKRSLYRHMRGHGVDTRYNCPSCDASFSRNDNLKLHMKMHTSNIGATFTSNKNTLPSTKDQDNMDGDQDHFQCILCNVSYENMADLSTHMTLHSNADGIIDHQLADSNGLPDETQMDQTQDDEQQQYSDISAADKKLSSKGEETPCSQCEKIFMSSEALEFHVKQMHSVQCPVCYLQLSHPADMYEHLQWHSQLSYEKSMESIKKRKEGAGSLKNSNKSDNQGINKKIKLTSPIDSRNNVIHLQGLSSEFNGMNYHLQAGMIGGVVKLECTFCGKANFANEDLLQLHVSEIHGVSPAALLGGLGSGVSQAVIKDCLVCEKSFAGQSEVTHHMQKNHPREYLYLMERMALSTHQQIQQQQHTGIVGGNSLLNNSYPCEFCPLNFGDSESLSMHQENVHQKMGISSSQSKSSDTVLCAQCSQSFTNIYSLAHHVQTAHSGGDATSGVIDSTGGSKSSHNFGLSTSSSRVPSPKAGLHVITPEGLTIHSLPAGHTSPPSNNSISNEADVGTTPGPNVFFDSETRKSDDERKETGGYLDGSVNIKEEDINKENDETNGEIINEETHTVATKNIPCPQCQLVLRSDEEFENHMTVHFLAMGTEYGCTSCMKLFSQPDELQKHLIDIHAHHLYRCSLCKEIFDSKVNIQVHFAIKHSNECKLYKCTRCVAIFRSEMEWQLHVKVQHLGMSKPYCCLFCKHSFTTDEELEQHLTTHKKQFECHICKEGFHVEYLLDKHMQELHSNSQQGDNMITSSLTQTQLENEAVYGQGSPGGIAGTTPAGEDDHSKTGVMDLSLSPRSGSVTLPTTPPRPSALRAALQASPSTSALSGSTSCSLTSSQAGGHPQVCKCEICGMKFTSEEAMIKHKLSDHSVMTATSAMEVDVLLQKNALTPKVSQLLGVADKFGQICVYCTQSFKTKAELEKHMKSHVSPSKQKCNICDQVFPSASVLAEHRLTHSKVVRGDVCVVCKLVMKNEEHFYVHSQEHGLQGSTMTCIVCRQTLASILELQLHGKAHFTVKNTPAYLCCVCLKAFETKENLIAKMNSSGKNYYVCKPCYHGEIPGSSSSINKSTVHQHCICKICGLRFSSQIELDSHMTLHKKSFQCIKCQESFASEYEIQVHVAGHMLQEGNIHHCRICNHRFDSPARLQCHLIEHTFEGSDIVCYVCDHMFSDPGEMQLHVLKHGTGARRYCCSQCNQSFFFSAEMQNHLYIVHNIKPSDNSYKCPECAKVFTNIINLNNHRKLHDTLKDATLKCTKCPLTFRSFTEVQQHFVMVHSPQNTENDQVTEDITPHKCAVCGELFTGLLTLSEHMKIHDSGGAKYSCSKCNSNFHSYQNFEVHMKSHESGGPFLCSVCHKSFSRKESMRSHMKCHTGIKPFRCDKCSKTFSHKSQLKDHVATHQDQTICDSCSKSFETPKELWRHQVIMHNMKTGHTCHICNSTYSDSNDLEFHMKRVHGLEKISWSVKDKCGHRCVVCNSPYKNLKDLEFHVQQIHGFNTSKDAYHPDSNGVSAEDQINEDVMNGESHSDHNEKNKIATSTLDLSHSNNNKNSLNDSLESSGSSSSNVIILKNDQNSNVESMDLSLNGDGNGSEEADDCGNCELNENSNHSIVGNNNDNNVVRFPEPVCF